MDNKKHMNLLHKQLSYQIRGIAIEVKKNYGSGHKEVLYQRAFAEELDLREINYRREKPIKVYSPKTGKVIGSYQPDFIIEDKIIIELKALEQMPHRMIDQLYGYLRNSKYELGFLINFNSGGVDIKRVIYTNDRKEHLQPQTGTQTRSQCQSPCQSVLKSVSVSVKYMQSALKLARRGIGSVEPNPAVGAIIVKKDRIIGRGWHKKFGGPHAEINALADCRKRGHSPQQATMYVTLEPCRHHGKTAPCTDAIIAAGLAKVLVATLDPSEHAGGKGIEQLRNAGIEVKTGLCETQARLLNAPFIKFAATGQCWTVLKWAQSIDGKLAYADKTAGRWLSGEKSRKDTHKLRRRVGAILVGIGTVLADDPLLTARPSKGKEITRIVLDSRLRIPMDCKLLATAKKMPVLIATSTEALRTHPESSEKIAQKGAELLTVPTTQGQCDIKYLLAELSSRGITQLLVEGGPTVITSFLKEQLADEIRIYIAPKILSGSGTADITGPMAELTEAIGLHHVDIKQFGDDIRLTGLLQNSV